MALIDTHKVVKEFIAVGLKEDQAEAITQAISSVDDKLATRPDLQAVKVELKSGIARLEDKLELNMKWMFAISGAIFLLLLKLVFFGS
jgi:hypothetical protein